MGGRDEEKGTEECTCMREERREGRGREFHSHTAEGVAAGGAR